VGSHVVAATVQCVWVMSNVVLYIMGSRVTVVLCIVESKLVAELR
jgi:hypothetical protein